MKSPNFLHNLHILPKKQPMSCAALLIFFILAIIFLFASQLFAGITFLTLGVVLLLVFTFKPAWGLYALTASSFFIGLEVAFANYDTTRNIAYLSSLNAPLVDFIAIMLLLSIGVAWFLHVKPMRLQHLLQAFPGFWWYGLFLFSSLVSLAFIYNHEIGIGVKYFFRSMLFSYIAFVWLPMVFIRDKNLLERVLRVWAWVGIGSMLFGLSSVFVVSHAGWVRFVPYAFFDIAPLGFNHNLLAEALVTLIPIASYSASITKKHVWRKGLWIGVIGMIGVALFTLSRAAWIVFVLQAIAAAFLFKDELLALVRRHSWIKFAPLIVIVPVVAYMALFLTSSIVESSTTARWEATKVAAFYAARRPVLGYGPGMYQQVLSDTAIYRLDFGDPLESHGFLQKVGLEEGVLGLFFFVGFLIWVLHTLWHAAKKKHSENILYKALFLSVFGIIVFQLFNTSYFNSVMWLPIGVGLAAVKLRGKI